MVARLRRRAGLKQEKLALEAGLSKSYIGAIERGKRVPPPATMELIADHLHVSAAERARLLEILHRSDTPPETPGPPPALPAGDSIPSLGPMYGRKEQLATLEDWLLNDGCRIVGIVGMEGMGKTTLASCLATKVQVHFEAVCWRSLVNKPTPEETLHRWLNALHAADALGMPMQFDDQLDLFISLLRSRPYLLVLDNLESVLETGKPAGTFCPGYEGYGRIIEQLGSVEHESCLLLTSRELPAPIVIHEGEHSAVRVLRLRGIGPSAGRRLLEDHQMSGADADRDDLVRRYSGNPLALKLIASTIRELFGADVARFIASGEMAVSDLRQLLDRQFERLTSTERLILYWLAIERVAVSPERLQDNLVPVVPKHDILDALASLARRSLLEKPAPARFTLQPVIMEYMTRRHVAAVCAELTAEAGTLDARGQMNSYALIVAQAADDVRTSQTQLLLAPVADHLRMTYGSGGAVARLTDVLARLRAVGGMGVGYAAGNALNLLVQLHADLRGHDLSHLVARQAFLRDVELHDVNFAGADLSTAIFSDTFGGVLSLAYHPHRPLLAAGTMDGEIRIWDITRGMVVHEYQAHAAWVGTLAFSPDGRMLASGSDDGTIRVRDVATGTVAGTPQGHDGPVRGLAWRPDGQKLASSDDDGTIRLFDIESGESQVVVQLADRVRALAWSPDGYRLIGGCDDGTLFIQDTSQDTAEDDPEGRRGGSLGGRKGAIRSVAFSPDGRHLAVASGDGHLRIWDLSSAAPHIVPGRAVRVWSLAFSPDGRWLACACEDRTVRVYLVGSRALPRLHRTLEGHTERVRAVAFRSDSLQLATGSDDQTVRLLAPESGQVHRTLRAHTGGVRAVAFSSDGKTLARCGDDPTIRLLDMSEPGAGRVRTPIRGHSGRVVCAAFSPDGCSLASGGEDRSVRLSDTRDGVALAVLHAKNCVRAVAFAPDGRMLASGGDDHTVRLWDVERRVWVSVHEEHAGPVRALAFAHHGDLLISGGDDGTLRLWDGRDGSPRRVLTDQCDRVRALAVSPDGHLLATGGADRSVRLWSMDTGAHVCLLGVHRDWVRTVAFAPDGRMLASGGDDHTVRLWDVKEQCLLHELGEQSDGHTNRVWSLAFRPDGLVVASGSEDDTVKLWNVADGFCETTLRADRTYERMNITGAVGLSEAQRASLRLLGAVDE